MTAEDRQAQKAVYMMIIKAKRMLSYLDDLLFAFKCI